MCIALLAVGIAMFSLNACSNANAQTGRANTAQVERWEYKVLERPRVWTEDNGIVYYTIPEFWYDGIRHERRYVAIEGTLNNLT